MFTVRDKDTKKQYIVYDVNKDNDHILFLIHEPQSEGWMYVDAGMFSPITLL